MPNCYCTILHRNMHFCFHFAAAVAVVNADAACRDHVWMFSICLAWQIISLGVYTCVCVWSVNEMRLLRATIWFVAGVQKRCFKCQCQKNIWKNHAYIHNIWSSAFQHLLSLCRFHICVCDWSWMEGMWCWKSWNMKNIQIKTRSLLLYALHNLLRDFFSLSLKSISKWWTTTCPINSRLNDERHNFYFKSKMNFNRIVWI